MRTTSLARWAMAWGLTIAPAEATVWLVDDNPGVGVDFDQVQWAVDAAVDGDTILIRPGKYNDVFIQAKALSLVGDGTGTATIEGLSVRTLGPGQRVRIQGLTLQGKDDEGLILKNNQGPVLLEGCTIIGGHGYSKVGCCDSGHPDAWHGVVVQNCSGVLFRAL